MDEQQERSLVQSAQGGDRDAFEMLMQAHYQQVYRVACRLLRSHDDTDVVTQEVFLQAFRSLRQFDGRSRLMTWLYTITVRKATDQQRRLKARPPMKAMHEGLAVDLRRPVNPDPPAEAHRVDMAQMVGEAIRRLPPDHRSAVALVVQEGVPYREAARMLGCSLGTVAWRVWDAKRLLKEMLAGRISSEDVA